MPLEICHPETDLFNLSSPEMSQLSLHSPFAPLPDTTQETAGRVESSESSRISLGDDYSGSKADASRVEGCGVSTGFVEGQRQQHSVSHGLTPEEVGSQLPYLLELGSDPMHLDYPPTLEPAEPSSPRDGSSRWIPNRRTTIIMEDIAPETLMNVMQILIHAKAKVRLETE